MQAGAITSILICYYHNYYYVLLHVLPTSPAMAHYSRYVI
jgi:hypothetical protein